MKKKFGNLGLDSALSSFVTNSKNEEETQFNPLTDKKPKKKDEQEKEEKQVTNDSKPAEPVKEVQKETSNTVIENVSEKPVSLKPKTIKNVSNFLNTGIPDDFKPHSALFSSGQLDELRNLVNFKKWKETPKFTIQMAIFEAIENLLQNRNPVNEFPDDFITYAPAFSETQWQRLEEFVSEIRFKQKGQYALKYAIYEAIKMYLDNNPIKY
ncbi:MAG: hypothetical protein GXX85_00900 [Ignavibacteria bacterium]|nr:hypothetical protein [Ignavibacteria bacterium]